MVKRFVSPTRSRTRSVWSLGAWSTTWPTTLSLALERLDELIEPTGVDELELREVEHEPDNAVVVDRLQGLRRTIGRVHIEFADKA